MRKLLGFIKSESTEPILFEDCDPRMIIIAQQNALQSTLLSLPPEILEIIVSYAIGANGNLIHIKHTQSLHMGQWSIAYIGKLPPPGFHHAVCEAIKTEDAAYAEANSKDGSVYRDPTLEYDIQRNEIRHYDCSCTSIGGFVRTAEMLSFVLFASCRQLYHLANTTLYAKNTFSFDDAPSFAHFLANLHPKQRKMIKSLHLSKKVEFSLPLRNKANWMNALEPSSIRALEGLRTVHLRLDMRTHTPNSWTANSAYNARLLEFDLEPFLQLRVLPLTKATVIISDNVHMFTSTVRGSSIHGRWTVAEKNEWAEKTRLKLLEPYVEGPEVAVDPREEARKPTTLTKRAKTLWKRASCSWLRN